MKIIIFTSLLFLSLSTMGQQSAVLADPAIKQVGVANIDQSVLSASSIPLDYSIELKIPIVNNNLNNGLPLGSCKIKIGLGSKMVLDPQFNLNSLPSSAYFNWTFDNASGQGQITGDLTNDLPPNYSEIVTFNVKGSIQGNSTITTNFLVTNHNTAIVLSDENPANNNSFLAYAVVPAAPLPVTFTGLTAINKDCSIQVDFYTEREINVKKYEIELSKDGINFVRTGEITAENLPHYKYEFPLTDANKAAVVFVRVKSIDKDASFKYSATKSLRGQCDKEWAIGVYPNPASSATSNITLINRQGTFNGKFAIILSDMSGRQLLFKEMNLANVQQFNVETGKLAAGQYIVNIRNQAESKSVVLKWQKY